MQMDVTKTWEDNSNKSSTLHDNSTLSKIKVSDDEEISINMLIIAIFLVSLSVTALFIAVFVCYIKANRFNNSGNTQRQSNGSESCDIYQNADIMRGGQPDDSQGIIANLPPSLPTERSRLPAHIPAIPEDDYLIPISAGELWRRDREEIRLLPPAPPPFPSELERLQLDGENAYTPVIPDDATPLLTPRPIHEITLDPQLCELREECGYVVPSSLLENSPQQTVTETDLPPEPREITQEGNKYQTRARTVVTSHGAVQQRPGMSAGRLLAEGASGSSDTRNETERPKITPRKRYRSECQVYLSPPIQHRSIHVSTSTPTLVVCIHTNHDNLTNI
jgi:hypothetical protein